MQNIEFRDMRTVARAFLSINVVAGKEDVIVNRLLKLEEIREVYIVPGDYDLLVVMEVERDFLKPDSEKFVEIVKERVRRIAGVSQTKTLIRLTSKIKN